MTNKITGSRVVDGGSDQPTSMINMRVISCKVDKEDIMSSLKLAQSTVTTDKAHLLGHVDDMSMGINKLEPVFTIQSSKKIAQGGVPRVRASINGLSENEFKTSDELEECVMMMGFAKNEFHFNENRNTGEFDRGGPTDNEDHIDVYTEGGTVSTVNRCTCSLKSVLKKIAPEKSVWTSDDLRDNASKIKKALQEAKIKLNVGDLVAYCVPYFDKDLLQGNFHLNQGGYSERWDKIESQGLPVHQSSTRKLLLEMHKVGEQDELDEIVSDGLERMVNEMFKRKAELITGGDFTKFSGTTATRLGYEKAMDEITGAVKKSMIKRFIGFIRKDRYWKVVREQSRHGGPLCLEKV